MFTGIIAAKGKVFSSKDQRGSRIFTIEKPRAWRLAKGASVSVDGICSTVRSSRARLFEVEYMPETLSKTTVADWRKDRSVNLERSLRLSDALDGHFVQGHVEGVGKVARVIALGNSREITIRVPHELVRYIAPKGSIAVNGVALTVAHVRGESCTMALIPYTLEHTNLRALKKGEEVNIETDLIARYLARLHRK